MGNACKCLNQGTESLDHKCLEVLFFYVHVQTRPLGQHKTHDGK